MDEEQAKNIVFEEWEKWNLDREIAQTKPPPKQTFGQKLINRLGIKVPENKPREFALFFYAKKRRSLIKGFTVTLDDIQNWALQKEASKAHLEEAIKLRREIELVVTPHFDTLLKKRRRLSIKDDYGFADDTKWQKELDYFIDQAIVPRLKEIMESVVEHMKLFVMTCNPEIENLNYVGYGLADVIDGIKEDINEALDDYEKEIIEEEIDVSLLAPNEYEYFCADLLEKIGWDVRVTQASRDQGIDVLAEKDGFLLALQCKRYSSPVGNKAVQEAFSGGTFYEAKAFAVVSPVEYTSSAKELANSLGVLLLHHEDLSSLTVTDEGQE